MMLFALSHDGLYLTPDATGTLAFTASLPGRDQQIIAANLSRPHDDHRWWNDKLLMRFARSGNVVRLGATNRSLVEHHGPAPVVADRPAPQPDEIWDIADPIDIFQASLVTERVHALIDRLWPSERGPSYRPETEELVEALAQQTAERGMEVQLTLASPLNFRFTNPTVALLGAPLAAAALAPALQRDVYGVLLRRQVGVRDGRLLAGINAEWLRLEPLGVKVHLEASNGQYLSIRADGTIIADRVEPFANEELLLRSERMPHGYRFFHGDPVTLRGWNGAKLGWHSDPTPGHGTIAARQDGGFVPLTWNLEREAGAGELRDGERVRFVPREIGGGARLAIGSDRRLIYDTATTAPTTFTVRMTQRLRLTWNDASMDHASVAAEDLVRRPGYRELRTQAYVYIGPRPGTVPLESFFHPPSTDTITTATETGRLTPLSQGYTYLGIQGFVHSEPESGTVTLRQYFSETRRDNLLAAIVADDRIAGDTDYNFAWTEGYARPAPEPVPVAPPHVGTVTAPVTATLAGAPTIARVGAVGGTVASSVVSAIASTRVTAPVRTALILSGGGAKGCFEVGVAQRLWEQGYAPDLICGASCGSINATKLAEGTHAAAELVQWWKELASTRGGLFWDRFYLSSMERLFEGIAGRLADTGIGALLGSIFGSLLMPGFGIALGGVLGAFAGKDLSDLDEASVRMINAILVTTHSLHSMEPLRRVLESRVAFDSLRTSKTRLRVGITCATTGQFFSVSGPDPAWTADPDRQFGYVEVERDHQLGASWLDQPLYGAPSYVMRLPEAIYASSALPGFMEPAVVDLRNADRVTLGGARYTRLQTGLPPGMREVIDADRTPARGDTKLRQLERALDGFFTRYVQNTQERRRELGAQRRDVGRGTASWSQYLFDGGLRDTMPIRTALRLGARDITVVTGDRLQQLRHAFVNPNSFDRSRATDLFALLGGSSWIGVDVGSIPALQHLMGLLGIWFNEVARTDLLLTVAQGEFLGWARRGWARLDAAGRAELERDIERYWSERGRVLVDALGGAHWLGGRGGSFDYGHPPFDKVRIRLIAPDREIVDALAFEDYSSVVSGIELGYQAALAPAVLTDHLADA